MKSARTTDGVDYRIRPIRADDAARERDFILRLSPASRHARFMHTIKEPSPEFVRQLVQVDGRRSQAVVAVIGEGDDERIIGVARYGADENEVDCEFAVAVADDWQCRGIGTTLTRQIFDAARQAGFKRVYGTMLADNARMLELAEHLGLTVEPWDGQQPTVRAALRLN